jgi:hypothetical protein
VAAKRRRRFIDNTPELFRFRAKRDRATKILSYLGDVIVNGRPDVKGKIDPEARAAEPVVPTYDAWARRRRRGCGISCWSWGRKILRVGSQAEAAAVHRYDDARCASIAAGDARAHA